MLVTSDVNTAFAINDIASCDFDQLSLVNNLALLDHHFTSKNSAKILAHLNTHLGVEQRYICSESQNSLTLARSALSKLLERNPELVNDADFLIYAGISNPKPVTTCSALLAGQFDLQGVSCWDIKSGCSSGVLGLIHALNWFALGAKCGILICSENLSKFANPKLVQTLFTVGDGAVALYLKSSSQWQVKGLVHGTDGNFAQNIYINASYPPQTSTLQQTDYYYEFDKKNETIDHLQHYWHKSLAQLLSVSSLSGRQVNHYFAHQVGRALNEGVTNSANIAISATLESISKYANVGCPGVFLNYLNYIEQRAGSTGERSINELCKPGDNIIFHAVGGGISWAAICLQFLGD